MVEGGEALSVGTPDVVLDTPTIGMPKPDPAWLLSWLKEHEPDHWGFWLGKLDPIPFDEWLVDNVKPADQDLAADLHSVCRSLFDEDPDQLPETGLALTDSRVTAYFGNLVREDRILRHSKLSGFPASRVDKMLGQLQAYGWIVRGGFLRPSPHLEQAVACAHGVGTIPSPVAACAAVAGDHVVGALLHQVRYWRHRARIRRSGLRWIVKTRDEWCAETGLTRHQYDRALRCLKERGLVQAEQHLYKGRNQTFLRSLVYLARGPRRETDGIA